MNTEIILLEQDITVDEAISLIRRGMEEDMEIPYYAYVVDEDDKLVGVFSLRDLMLSKPGTILRDSLHDQDVIAVRYDTSSEEVARRMSHYNFMAMPVVDYEGRLLGVATYDDILDIMQDEASADLLGMVGAGQDETVDTPCWSRCRYACVAHREHGDLHDVGLCGVHVRRLHCRHGLAGCAHADGGESGREHRAAGARRDDPSACHGEVRSQARVDCRVA